MVGHFTPFLLNPMVVETSGRVFNDVSGHIFQACVVAKRLSYICLAFGLKELPQLHPRVSFVSFRALSTPSSIMRILFWLTVGTAVAAFAPTPQIPSGFGRFLALRRRKDVSPLSSVVSCCCHTGVTHVYHLHDLRAIFMLLPSCHSYNSILFLYGSLGRQYSQPDPWTNSRGSRKD